MHGLWEHKHGAREQVHEEELLVYANSQPSQRGLQEVFPQPGEAHDTHWPQAQPQALPLSSGKFAYSFMCHAAHMRTLVSTEPADSSWKNQIILYIMQRQKEQLTVEEQRSEFTFYAFYRLFASIWHRMQKLKGLTFSRGPSQTLWELL